MGGGEFHKLEKCFNNSGEVFPKRILDGKQQKH
jgi:hypothetical protein